jgi:carbon-monoxide dehydrogenase medium subunit
MIQTYHRPRSFSEALQLKARLKAAGTVVLGGSDLVVKIRLGRMDPVEVIDLSGAKLDYLSRKDDGLYIGAATSAARLLRSEWVCHEIPALWKSCLELGGPQVQNAATLGGNLANASPAADTPPALMVLDAQVVLESVGRGVRRLKVEEFLLGPGKTALADDELIREIFIPGEMLVPPRQGPCRPGDLKTVSAFYKMGPRRAQIISVCCVAGWACVRVEKEGGHSVRSIRLAAGGVAPRTVRLRAAEEVFARNPALTPEQIAEAGACVTESISPISDVRGSAEYKALLARNFTIEFLESLTRDAETTTKSEAIVP